MALRAAVVTPLAFNGVPGESQDSLGCIERRWADGRKLRGLHIGLPCSRNRLSSVHPWQQEV